MVPKRGEVFVRTPSQPECNEGESPRFMLCKVGIRLEWRINTNLRGSSQKNTLQKECILLCKWCPREDSNLHALRRYHLKVVRLPISPPGHCMVYYKTIFRFSSFLLFLLCFWDIHGWLLMPRLALRGQKRGQKRGSLPTQNQSE